MNAAAQLAPSEAASDRWIINHNATEYPNTNCTAQPEIDALSIIALTEPRRDIISRDPAEARDMALLDT